MGILSAVSLEEFVPDVNFIVGTILVLLATTIYSIGVPPPVQRCWNRHLGASRKSKIENSPHRGPFLASGDDTSLADTNLDNKGSKPRRKALDLSDEASDSMGGPANKKFKGPAADE